MRLCVIRFPVSLMILTNMLSPLGQLGTLRLAHNLATAPLVCLPRRDRVAACDPLRDVGNRELARSSGALSPWRQGGRVVR